VIDPRSTAPPCPRTAAAGKAEKKVNGRERLIVVDVTCLLLAQSAVLAPASGGRV